MKNALEAVPAGDALDAAPTTGAKNVAPATTPLNDILSRDTAVIRWGIVGTGRIARRFAQGLQINARMKINDADNSAHDK